MSISSALNNAITGLNASSRMAEVVSSNVANALTEGYGRRSVDLSSVNLAGQGAGVQVDGIRRHVNEGALADRRLASADLQNGERSMATLAALEQIFGAPDDPGGLSGRMAALEQSLLSAASDPASDQRLATVKSRLDQLASGLNQISSEVQNLRQVADSQIAADVDQLNTSLSQVERLNADIVHTTLSGLDPSPLLDARQVAIDQISAIVPVRLMNRDNGAIAIMTTSGEVMLDGPAAEYGFVQTPTIVPDMLFSGGVLSGLTRNGVPLSADNGFGKLSGGSLSAAFDMRDGVLVNAQQTADDIAADMISRFEQATVDPTLAPGDAGLLTDNGASFDPLNIIGLSSRISVNSAIDGTGGLFRLRDGINATIPGPVGSSEQLGRWSNALSSSFSISASIPSLSASGQIGRVTSQIASDSLSIEQETGFAAARWDMLNAAVLSDGVDTDYEMQMLLKIEQSYSANAKLIQTADRMLQTLMEI